MTIASLSGLSMVGREAFLHATANLTAQDPGVQQYVRGVNRTRSAQDVVQILSSMLTGALHPDQAYRLPVPTLLMHGDNDHLARHPPQHPSLGTARTARRVPGHPPGPTCQQPGQPARVQHRRDRLP
jgi:pimeloyl-ACP methyl ester carboxylesterase